MKVYAAPAEATVLARTPISIGVVLILQREMKRQMDVCICKKCKIVSCVRNFACSACLTSAARRPLKGCTPPKGCSRAIALSLCQQGVGPPQHSFISYSYICIYILLPHFSKYIGQSDTVPKIVKVSFTPDIEIYVLQSWTLSLGSYSQGVFTWACNPHVKKLPLGRILQHTVAIALGITA